MTDKEMHKLSRRELLQLLLTQGKETEKLRKSLAAREEELQKLTENYERLKKRLDYKDEQISGLKKTLYDERTNRKIELDEAGSLAEAALRLNGVFDVAQKAAEQYLYNIRLLYDKKVAEYSAIEGSEDSLDQIAEKNTDSHLGIEEKNEETASKAQEALTEEDKSELSESPEDLSDTESENREEESLKEEKDPSLEDESSKEEKDADSEEESSKEEKDIDLENESAEEKKDSALEEVELEENASEKQEDQQDQGKPGRFKRWKRHAKNSK